LPYHDDGCLLTSEYSLIRVRLPREEIQSLISLSLGPAFDSADPNPTQFFPLGELPTEILQCVFGYLTAREVGAMELVSRNFLESASDEQFWKFLVKRDFHLHRIRTPRSDGECNTWKSTYLSYHSLFHWIKEVILLEEAYYPRYTIQVAEDGDAEVVIRLVGRKYLFNLDGRAFTFDEEFMLILMLPSPGKITSVKITALGQPIAKTIELCGLMPLPAGSTVTMANIQNYLKTNGKISLTLALEETALDRWLRPYLSGKVAPGFHSFLMLKDNVGGSVIMDLFYYTLQNLVVMEEN